MFGVREIAGVCEIPYGTLKDWLLKGVVKPKIWGRSGCYDVGHRFSNVQAVALAFMGWLHDEYRRNLGPQYVKELMAKAEECDEGRLHWLVWGLEPDAWQEEWLAMLRTLSPTLEKCPESLSRRLDRVIQAIKQKESEAYRPGHNRMRRRARRRV